MKCWNCGSLNYVNLPATEYCPDCRISCEYHGETYENDEWKEAMDRRMDEIIDDQR